MISDAMGHVLDRISIGKDAQAGHQLSIFRALSIVAEERGLARTVCHRDRTRSYELTKAGAEALAAWRTVRPAERTAATGPQGIRHSNQGYIQDE